MEEIIVTDDNAVLTVWNEGEFLWEDSTVDIEEIKEQADDRNISEMEEVCSHFPNYWLSYKEYVSENNTLQQQQGPVPKEVQEPRDFDSGSDIATPAPLLPPATAVGGGHATVPRVRLNFQFRIPLEGIFLMDQWYPDHYTRKGDPWQHLFDALDVTKKDHFTWGLSRSDSDGHMHSISIDRESITFVAPKREMFFEMKSPQFRDLFLKAMQKLHERIVFIKQRMVQRYPEVLKTLIEIAERYYDEDRKYR
jgi:hypothetical protein